MTLGRRRLERFLNDPSSLRSATLAIVSVTILLVITGAIVIRVFDPDAYPTIGAAVWFTLQTVTTVGYGDNLPESTIGRVVAGVVMLVSIGLITVITAAITSLFVQAARQRKDLDVGGRHTETLARVEASLAALHERLDRIDGGASDGDDHRARQPSDRPHPDTEA